MAISTTTLKELLMQSDENMKAINEAVNSVLTLAMLNNNRLHIDIKYVAYINEIEVKIFNRNTDYSTGHKRNFSCSVYLDNPNALNTLKSLESKLINLINKTKARVPTGCSRKIF